MAQTYAIISYVAFALAAIALIVSIILGVKYKIVKIISDLSGRSAQKSIERMREENERNYKTINVYHKTGFIGKSLSKTTTLKEPLDFKVVTSIVYIHTNETI